MVAQAITCPAGEEAGLLSWAQHWWETSVYLKLKLSITLMLQCEEDSSSAMPCLPEYTVGDW